MVVTVNSYHSIMVVAAMDKLTAFKKLILMRFNTYVFKLTKGYTHNELDYKRIKAAMMAVNFIESYTLEELVIDNLIELHTLRLKRI